MWYNFRYGMAYGAYYESAGELVEPVSPLCGGVPKAVADIQEWFPHFVGVFRDV